MTTAHCIYVLLALSLAIAVVGLVAWWRDLGERERAYRGSED